MNSNLPAIVVSTSHAWVVNAYTRKQSGGNSSITLYRHDDAFGPYVKVDNPWAEPHPAHQPWLTAILPLPPKIYMTAEKAEAVGRWSFGQHVGNASAGDPILETQKAGRLSLITYGIAGRDYKHGLLSRANLDPVLAREYRLSSWPRNIWVVEAVDKSLRDAGQPAVLGEAIIDPTAHREPNQVDTGLLALHVPGSFAAVTPDFRNLRTAVTHSQAYETGRPA